jgi:hypothetical protein
MKKHIMIAAVAVLFALSAGGFAQAADQAPKKPQVEKQQPETAPAEDTEDTEDTAPEPSLEPKPTGDTSKSDEDTEGSEE